MKRKVLLTLGAAAAIAVGGMTMGTAEAKTHVYLGFGVGAPWGYYYPPPPYWGYYYYPPAPYYYYPAPRYRTRCWRVKRWRRVWNGRRWVKRRIWVRKCRRVRVR